MEKTRLAMPTKARWYVGLTADHWRVLRGGFLGWIFDGFEALAVVVVLAPMLKSL